MFLIFLRWHDDERDDLLKLKPKKVNIKAFTEDIFPMGGEKEIDRYSLNRSKINSPI